MLGMLMQKWATVKAALCENWCFALGLPLQAQRVFHFYAAVVNTDRAVSAPSWTAAFVDEPKEKESDSPSRHAGIWTLQITLTISVVSVCK